MDMEGLNTQTVLTLYQSYQLILMNYVALKSQLLS